MSKYRVQVRKKNLEWNDINPLYTFMWLASIEGAKWLRRRWEVRVISEVSDAK